MLSCKDITHKADEFLEKRLPWHTRLAFKIHLFMCVNCRRYVSQIRLTINTLRKLGQSEKEPEDHYVAKLADLYKNNKN